MNIIDCNRCGKCKEVCPSYRIFLNESFSPRGRFFLYKAMQDRNIEYSKALRDRILSCLLCGSCIEKCPIKVDVPMFVYEIRSFMKKNLSLSLFKYFSIHPKFFISLFNKINKFKILPHLLKKQRLIPSSFISKFSSYKVSISENKSLKIFNKLKPSGRIALFLGCSTQYMMPSITNSLAQILNEINYEVIIPKQKCCGAPLLAAGFRDEAINLANKNILSFNSFKIDGVISPCPTCSHFISSIYEEIIGDKIKVIKLSDLLDNQNLEKYSKLNLKKIYFHNSCHSANYLHEGNNISNLLNKMIEGEIDIKEGCCGFAGLFSYFFEKQSIDITKQKILEYEKADMIVTSCPNCKVQFQYIMQDKLILHYAEFINNFFKGVEYGRKRA